MHIESNLEKLQNIIEKRLLQIHELRNIPVLNYKQSDFTSILSNNAKIGIGIAILLMPPIPSHANPYIEGPIFDHATLEINVIENTATNQNGPSLLCVAETIMRHLHMWHHNNDDQNDYIQLASGTSCCSVERKDNNNYFIMRFIAPCNITSPQL